MATLCFAVVDVRWLSIDALCCSFPLCLRGRLRVGGARRGFHRLLAHELNRPFVNDGGSQRLPGSHWGPSEFYRTAQLDDAVFAVLTQGNTRDKEM